LPWEHCLSAARAPDRGDPRVAGQDEHHDRDQDPRDARHGRGGRAGRDLGGGHECGDDQHHHEPGEEDGALLLYQARGLGAEVTLLTLTRGERGENRKAILEPSAQGLRRTMEQLASDRQYGVEQRFARMVDFGLARTVDEAEELVALAERQGLVIMVGHTFLFSPAVRRLKQIVDAGDIGEVQYISARRLNLGLFQKDINVAWDLAPHDLSIILALMGEMPQTVNCRGSAHVTPGIEDVTTMCLSFSKERSATIQSSWLDPRKVREMTIVGSKRMIVYDDLAPLEKIRVFDMRVERPPHYDTFGEFQYAYHYGDMYAPYIKQEEPLKTECQHFLDCIRTGTQPVSCGVRGTELVKILEASSESLRLGGAPVDFSVENRPVAVQAPAAANRPAKARTGSLPRGARNGRAKLALNGGVRKTVKGAHEPA